MKLLHIQHHKIFDTQKKAVELESDLSDFF